MNSTDAEIRERACRSWDAAGRPEGRDLEFWYEAEQWIGSENRDKPSAMKSIWKWNLTMPSKKTTKEHAITPAICNIL